MFPWQEEEFVANTAERRAKYRQQWAKFVSTEKGREWKRARDRKRNKSYPMKKWREENPEKAKQSIKEWQSSDNYREYMRNYMRKYNKKKREEAKRLAESDQKSV